MKYKKVEVLREDGVTCTITQQINTGHYSFRIQREYELDEDVKTTNFLGRRHIPAITRLMNRVTDKIDLLIDSQNLEKAAIVSKRR